VITELVSDLGVEGGVVTPPPKFWALGKLSGNFTVEFFFVYLGITTSILKISKGKI